MSGREPSKGNALRESIERNALQTTGFSLYWAWLFLVAVTPSALFGQNDFFGPIPFEIPQIAFRCLALMGSMLVITRTKNVNYTICALLTAAAGTVVTLLLLTSPNDPASFTLAAACAGFVDTSLLLLWIGSFAHAKLGDMAMSIAASYAIGSLLCLLSALIGPAAMTALAIGSPVLSSMLFVFHYSHISDKREEDRTHTRMQPTISSLPAADRHMALALAIYALLFGFFSSASVYDILQARSNPLIQSLACMILFIVFAVLIHSRTENQGLYDMYRIIPLLISCGFAALAFDDPTVFLIAEILVSLGYDSFEALAYNDFANILKTSESFSLKPMAQLRLGASAGMLAGWVIAWGLSLLAPDGFASASGIVITAGVSTAVVTTTFLFTEKHTEGLSFIANQRAAQEFSPGQNRKQAIIDEYISEHSLSPRESEIFQYLLSGRTMAYAAEDLFISESTARTHVHNIYSKTETHSKMELLDDFERFMSERL